MATKSAALVWFRDDLRIADNPALKAALEQGEAVICLYILETQSDVRPLGAATKWWLHHSLASLSKAIEARGGKLILRNGDPSDIIPEICDVHSVSSVTWNRRYAPTARQFDADLKASLKEAGVEVESYSANLLNEPWTIKSGSGDPYRVFTPYWKACLAQGEPTAPLPAPKSIPSPKSKISSDNLKDWDLTPTKPDWATGFDDVWQPGEDGANTRLTEFLDSGLTDYKKHRDFPSIESTSRLSPHLRWGEISPRQIWSALRAKFGDPFPQDVQKFVAEIGWREFSQTLLFYADDLASENWKPAFDEFEWAGTDAQFDAWCKGRTGYPLVDAGMRELWATGWMHNRVRMVVASFLIKHLLIDWRRGEKWFWDTLVDADDGSNPASWQWVAGSGADAAPFFRIFNPLTQSKKFDEEAAYIRKWVPELTNCSNKEIHDQKCAKDYVEPIVDHKAARERALNTYQDMKSSTD